MFQIETAFFCEKSYALKDGKYFIAAPFPGIVNYAGPRDQSLVLDAFAAVRFDHPGQHDLDVMVSSEQGQTILLHTLNLAVEDPRFPVQIAMGGAPLPAVEGAVYMLSFKLGASPWRKACSLRVIASFREPEAPPARAS